jgi:hypothetical protein
MPARPVDEVDEIQQWLRRHYFKRMKNASDQPGETSWARGRCQVKVRRGGEAGYVIAIRGNAESVWEKLEQVLSRLDKNCHRPVQAPIAVAVSHFLGFEVSEPPSLGAKIYAACQPHAYVVKIILQMLIGIGAVAGLGLALYFAQDGYHGIDTWKSAAELSIGVITAALSAAGAVELAYTLYTPGPDEALDPLMLGLSAGILLVITRSDIPVGWQFLGVILGIFSLWALFRIRQRFIDSDDL